MSSQRYLGDFLAHERGLFHPFFPVSLSFPAKSSVDLPEEARLLQSVQEARKSKIKMRAVSGGDSFPGLQVAIFPSDPHRVDSRDGKPSVSGHLFHKSPAFLNWLPPKACLSPFSWRLGFSPDF